MVKKSFSKILLALVLALPFIAQAQAPAAHKTNSLSVEQQVARGDDVLIDLDELTTMESPRVRILLA